MVDEEIALIPYYPNPEAALPWYRDCDVCKWVDNIDKLCSLEWLNTVLYPGIILAGTSPLGVEHARRVTANIYDFNTQSRKMFLSLDFQQTGKEWYVLDL